MVQQVLVNSASETSVQTLNPRVSIRPRPYHDLLVSEENTLCEHMPCNGAAETVLHPLIWCFGILPFFSGGSFLS